MMVSDLIRNPIQSFLIFSFSGENLLVFLCRNYSIHYHQKLSFNIQLIIVKFQNVWMPENFAVTSIKLSLVMRKPDFCICENKDADQLRGNREADQHLCFRYTLVQSIYYLNPKFQASSHLLKLYSLVCV